MIRDILHILNEKIIESPSSEYTINKVSGNNYEVTHIQPGKDDSVYHITKEGHNWQCDCPAFKYRGGKVCKHIQMLLDMGEIKPEKPRQPIERMQPMIDAIKPILDKYDSSWEVVGSYRRGKDTFKDVDILMHCSEGDFVKLADELKSLPNYSSDISGTELIRGLYTVDDLPIDLDINRVYTDAPAAMLLYRTGPADLNVFMRKKAMSYGWSLSEKGILDHVTGNKVNVPQDTEEEIFTSLGLPYLTPSQREHWQDFINVSHYESIIRNDMQDYVYNTSNNQALDSLVHVILNNKDDIINAVKKSKAKSIEDAIIYNVKKYATDYIKYPYKGELLYAFKKATGLYTDYDWR